MSMISIFILTTAIGIESSRSPSSESKNAYRALAKATYVQTNVDDKVKEIEKRVVPKSLKEYGGWITGIAKAVNEKKISMEWTF